MNHKKQMKTKRVKNKLDKGTDYAISDENFVLTRRKNDHIGCMLVISKPGWHGVLITRHEAACILWDAWRKGKEAA